MRKRHALVERRFAHTLDQGVIRRLRLRACGHIVKRYLIYVAGFNLGVLMRAHAERERRHRVGVFVARLDQRGVGRRPLCE